jgi:hypothetical protein
MNILENETFLTFGYTVSGLKKSSCKMVKCCCEKCLVVLDRKFRCAKLNKLCLKCSNKLNSNKNLKTKSEKLKKWYAQNKHPLLGTKRPQNVIDALVKSNKGKKRSDNFKADVSKRTKGVGNPFYGKKHLIHPNLGKKLSIETKQKIGAHKKGKTFEDLYGKEKANQLKNNLKKRMLGKNNHFFGKIFHPKRSNYFLNDIHNRTFYFRSSWELKTAQFLDINKLNWEYETRAFPVLINEKTFHYIPDFYIKEENYFIEVKGFWRLDAKEKYNLFLMQYPEINIKIWDKTVLKFLKII